MIIDKLINFTKYNYSHISLISLSLIICQEEVLIVEKGKYQHQGKIWELV